MKFDAFFKGEELNAYKLFGSHVTEKGVSFCVYAPHAYKVALISSFDEWDKEYPLDKIDERGIYQIEIEGLKPIYSYRYRIYTNDNHYLDKIDPYSYCFERRPANASCMYDLDYFEFDDQEYLKNKKESYDDEAINIYELYFNSFTKDHELATFREIKAKLVPYCLANHFNFVEFMPVFEHPFDGSWGYQASGFYGVTSRYGTPYDFMDLVNELHKNNMGVILYVVYAHFVSDEFALCNYDGQALYEYPEKHLQRSEWGSYYFNLYNPTVISFLMSSASFFLDRYHIDGLRFDAVSHFIYHGGNKDKGFNEEGISFIKRCNYMLKERYPKALLIAEDSSDYPKVTGKVSDGALGFDYKWDLGWMNDTLKYYAMDHEYRKYHHNLINFSMFYFYGEKFLLPLSHDEVVHGKKTIIDKMFGTYEEKFALYRNLMMYMFTHPGKKLNFMGNEIAQFREFDEQKESDYFLLDYPIHDAFNNYFKALSKLYLEKKALSDGDYNPNYFHWIDSDNNKQSVYSYYRENEKEVGVIILNMMPISYQDYEIGVPYYGWYKEIINSEEDIYNGCGFTNPKALRAKKKSKHNLPYTIKMNLAPFAAIIFYHKK